METSNPRLEALANNVDGAKSGQNNRRTARIREYEAEIKRVTKVIDDGQRIADLIEPLASESDYARHVVFKIYQEQAKAKGERRRLEHELATIKNAVQR